MLVCLIFTACGESRSSDSAKNSKRTSSSEKVIVQNIENLKENKWNKKAYTEILENQIKSSSRLRNAQREGLTHKLEVVYSGILVRDANDIMDNSCGANHTLLDQIVAELKDHKKDSGADAVFSRYNDHQAEMAFVSSIYSKQRLSNWNTAYDDSFEATKRKEVAAHRAKNPVCSYLKSRLEDNSVNAAYAQRRIAFANAVVDLYCKKPDYNELEEKQARSRVNFTLNKFVSASDKAKTIDKLNEKFDKFREEKEPKEAI